MPNPSDQFERSFDQQMKLIQSNLASGISAAELRDLLTETSSQYQLQFDEGTAASNTPAKWLAELTWSQTNDALALLDEDFTVQMVNQNASQLLGLPLEPIAPVNLLNFLDQDFAHLEPHPARDWASEIREQLDRSELWTANFSAQADLPVDPAGEIELRIHRVTFGQSVHHLMVARQLTDRSRRTESNPTKQRDRLLASVFESAHEGIVVLDLAGNICEANPEFCRISNHLPKHLDGRSLSQFADWELLEFDQLLSAAKS